MQTPTQEVFSVGIHTLHWLYVHRIEGTFFLFAGNMQTICFNDLADMQDLMPNQKSSHGDPICFKQYFKNTYKM